MKYRIRKPAPPHSMWLLPRATSRSWSECQGHEESLKVKWSNNEVLMYWGQFDGLAQRFSVPCLLMHWLLKSSKYQQPWYWLCRTDNRYCCSRINSISLGQAKSKISFKIWIYLLWFFKTIWTALLRVRVCYVQVVYVSKGAIQPSLCPCTVINTMIYFTLLVQKPDIPRGTRAMLILLTSLVAPCWVHSSSVPSSHLTMCLDLFSVNKDKGLSSLLEVTVTSHHQQRSL